MVLRLLLRLLSSTLSKQVVMKHISYFCSNCNFSAAALKVSRCGSMSLFVRKHCGLAIDSCIFTHDTAR
jgi:hypothetical protein